MTPRLVIFSELDGPLHDPPGSALAKAARVLDAVTHANVSLILSSRKTRAELEHLQQELGIGDPFICESGAAAFVPFDCFGGDVPGARQIAGYNAVEFGRTYSDVVATLHGTARKHRVAIQGFSDMSVEDVARECQVTLLRARLAKLREYNEPFRILDPHPGARLRLFKALQAARLHCTSVGPYHHVGAPLNRYAAVNLLRTLYRRAHDRVVTVALVDAAVGPHLVKTDYLVGLGNAEAGSRTLDLVDWAREIQRVVRNVQRSEAVDCGWS